MSRFRNYSKLKVEPLESRVLLAVDYVIHDLNAAGESFTKDVVALDDKLYFRDTSPHTGSELFSYDPTTNSKTLVADIYPGPTSSFPGEASELYAFNGKLYFAASAPGVGFELHEFDPGTGTARLVADINPGVADAFPGEPSGFYGYGERLYFSATTVDGKRRTWEFDTNTNNIEAISDPDVTWSIPREFSPLNGKLYFTDQQKLFAFDPVTRELRSIHEDFTSRIFAAAGKLYFSAENDTVGEELYVFDPSTDMVSLVSDLNEGELGSSPGDPGGFALLDDKLYFSAETELTGTELFVLDTQTDTVELVADIRPGESSSRQFSDGEMVVLNGDLYFAATRSPFVSKVLHSYNPSSGQVNRFNNVGVGRPNIIVFDGKLYYNGYTDSTGRELFEFDPDLGESIAVTDIAASGYSGTEIGQFGGLIALENSIYFTAVEVEDGDLRLYEFDTELRTLDVAVEFYGGTDSSIPGKGVFSPFDGRYYFPATNGSVSRELHFYDPLTKTTDVVTDIAAGLFPSNPGSATGIHAYEDRLYFGAWDSEHGFELREFNLSEGTVSLAVELMPGPAASGISEILQVGDNLYFPARDASHGHELRRLNLVTGETTLVADIASGSASSSPGDFFELGEKVYFSAETASLGRELYVLDLPTNAVTLAADIVSGNKSANPGVQGGFATIGGKLYFNARDQFNEEELYEYDPATGLIRMFDLRPGSRGSSPARLSGYAVLDNRLYFTAEDQLHAYSPAIDAVSEFPNTLYAGQYGGLQPFNGKLYFSKFTNREGYEIHTYDPTRGEVTMIDLNPGFDSAHSADFEYFSVGGRLYFPAQDNEFGNELRVLNPVTGAVTIVEDFLQGSDGSNPEIIATDDSGNLIITADTDYAGRELIVANVPDSDFSGDGVLDCQDIDALTMEIASGANNTAYDLNFDGIVNLVDRDIWLAEAGSANLSAGVSYLPGDANLDGSVDVSDFNAWNEHKFTNQAAWCSGDFDANGSVDVSDFNIWNEYKFTSAVFDAPNKGHGNRPSYTYEHSPTNPTISPSRFDSGPAETFPANLRPVLFNYQNRSLRRTMSSTNLKEEQRRDQAFEELAFEVEPF